MDIQKELIAEYDRELSRRERCSMQFSRCRSDMEGQPEIHDAGSPGGPCRRNSGSMGHRHAIERRPEFDMAGYKPWQPTSKAEILERFDTDTSKVKQIFSGFDPAKWDENWKMTAGDQVWIDDSRYAVFRTWVLNHLVHHRAQLGRDLRTLGARSQVCTVPRPTRV